MSRVYRHNWARPIYFENIELPGTCYAIDQLGMHGNLPDLSDEAGLWLWKFTICVGVIKHDHSQRIIRIATETTSKIHESHSDLLKSAPKNFDGPFDEQVISDWVSSLEIMMRVAKEQHICSWTAPHNWD